MRRHSDQPHRDFRLDAQRPAIAAEQPGKIGAIMAVKGRVAARPARARPDQRSIRRHDGQRDHALAGGAIMARAEHGVQL